MNELRKTRGRGKSKIRQRGSVILVAMTTLSGLLAVATVTLVKVKRGISASSESRFQSVALFAAESGVSVGMDFLRNHMDPTTYFSAYVTPGNSPNPVIQKPAGLIGNSKLTSASGGQFTDDVPMSYTVSILNNEDDPGFAAALNRDRDGIVVLHSIGKGPGNSRVVLEVIVDGTQTLSTGRPCPGYAQSGMSADGAGRNDCLTNVDSTVKTTVRPGI